MTQNVGLAFTRDSISREPNVARARKTSTGLNNALSIGVTVVLRTRVLFYKSHVWKLAEWFVRAASYRTVAFCVLRQKSLTPVSAHFLRQESIPSDYLWQATCVTLGVMSKFDAAQQIAAKRRTQQALYEVTFTEERNTVSGSPQITQYQKLLSCRAVVWPDQPFNESFGTETNKRTTVLSASDTAMCTCYRSLFLNPVYFDRQLL